MKKPSATTAIDAELVDSKTCNTCEQMLPLTEFHVNRYRPDGRGDQCKTCCKTIAKEKAAIVMQNQQAIDDRIRDRLEAMLDACEKNDQLGAMRPGVPHTVQLFEQVMQAIGGPEGWALQMGVTFLISEPGSVNRQRILRSIQEMSESVVKMGGARMPLDLMTDDDLESLVAEKAQRTLRLAQTDDQTEVSKTA